MMGTQRESYSTSRRVDEEWHVGGAAAAVTNPLIVPGLLLDSHLILFTINLYLKLTPRVD